MVTYTVTDREGASASIEVLWKIVNVNDDPVITTEVPTQLVTLEEMAFTHVLEAYDEDGDTLVWSDDSDLFDIDPSTGTISFTPAQEDVGAHSVTVTVDDGNGATASITFGLVVENVNDAPLISSVSPLDGATFKEGEAVTFSVEATDPDGDRLSYFWMEGDEEVGAGTPFSTRSLEAGSHTITLVVTDGTVNVDQDLKVKIVEREGPSDDDGPLSPILVSSIVLIIASVLLIAYVLMIRRSGPDEPLK
jgi:hypothetical protein